MTTQLGASRGLCGTRRPIPTFHTDLELIMTHEQAAYRRHPLDAEAPTVTDQPQTALRDRIAEALLDHLSQTADIRPGRDGALAFMPEVTDEERMRIADAVVRKLPPPADRATVCICGHTEEQHFEDACLVCDCGDYLVPEAAREVIARWRVAAGKEAARLSVDRGAVLNAAAQHLYTALFPAVYNDLGQKAAEGVNRAVSELRRLAAEAPQPEGYEATTGHLITCLAVAGGSPDPDCSCAAKTKHREVSDETRPLCACGRFWPCALADAPAVPVQPAADGWRGATELVPDREVQRLAATGLVGYQQDRGRLLHCLHHKPAPASRYVDFQEVTAEDLPEGGICVHPSCGADLLAVQPVAADNGKEA